MHFGSEYGPDRAVGHRPGSTRIEIWRRAAEMIRAALGDAVWVGCGCPLWASVGLVDGIRIGRDIGVEWKGNYSAESLLRDQATRNFGHGILWQGDPDCILLRERFHHLTDPEIRALARYAGMMGGVTMTSDALDELSPARLRLWQELLALPAGGCNYPRLGAANPATDATGATTLDPVLVQVRHGGTTGGMIFIFNPTDLPQQRRYAPGQLGLAGPLLLRDHDDPNPTETSVADVTVTVAPHDGRWLVFRQVAAGPPR
jgi:hypothetical protein